MVLLTYLCIGRKRISRTDLSLEDIKRFLKNLDKETQIKETYNGYSFHRFNPEETLEYLTKIFSQDEKISAIHEVYIDRNLDCAKRIKKYNLFHLQRIEDRFPKSLHVKLTYAKEHPVADITVLKNILVS